MEKEFSEALLKEENKNFNIFQSHLEKFKMKGMINISFHRNRNKTNYKVKRVEKTRC